MYAYLSIYLLANSLGIALQAALSLVHIIDHFVKDSLHLKPPHAVFEISLFNLLDDVFTQNVEKHARYYL